jgi:hypothetical protein
MTVTRLLTIPEAAKEIGMPAATLNKIIAAGNGPVLHPDCNRPRRVSEQNLQEWVDKRAPGTPA